MLLYVPTIKEIKPLVKGLLKMLGEPEGIYSKKQERKVVIVGHHWRLPNEVVLEKLEKRFKKFWEMWQVSGLEVIK